MIRILMYTFLSRILNISIIDLLVFALNYQQDYELKEIFHDKPRNKLRICTKRI